MYTSKVWTLLCNFWIIFEKKGDTDVMNFIQRTPHLLRTHHYYRFRYRNINRMIEC